MKRFFPCCLIVVGLNYAQVAYAGSYDLSFFSGPTGFRLLDSAGINNQGDVVGWGYNDTGGPSGLFRDPSGTISTFGVGGGDLTMVNGMNDRGQIVGNYYDGSGIHAFLRQPDGAIQTLQIP